MCQYTRPQQNEEEPYGALFEQTLLPIIPAQSHELHILQTFATTSGRCKFTGTGHSYLFPPSVGKCTKGQRNQRSFCTCSSRDLFHSHYSLFGKYKSDLQVGGWIISTIGTSSGQVQVSYEEVYSDQVSIWALYPSRNNCQINHSLEQCDLHSLGSLYRSEEGTWLKVCYIETRASTNIQVHTGPARRQHCIYSYHTDGLHYNNKMILASFIINRIIRIF
jgi:hypothetical protein